MSNSENLTIKKKVLAYSHHKNPFINILFDLVESNRDPEVIAWSPTGTSFIVYNRELFSQRILPNLFSHRNLSSFTRQLNMYDFKRCKAPRGKLSYSHPDFKKGRSDLLKNIKRNHKTKANEDTQEPAPSYEELLRINEELKKNQEKLEKKLKLSHCYITSLLRKNPKSAGAFDKIEEIYNGEDTLVVESKRIDAPSQLELEQQETNYRDSEAFESYPRKLVFQQEYDKWYQSNPLINQKDDERSLEIVDDQNMNFSNLTNVSPFNSNPLNQRKYNLIRQEDHESWDALISEMMLTGNSN